MKYMHTNRSFVVVVVFHRQTYFILSAYTLLSTMGLELSYFAHFLRSVSVITAMITRYGSILRNDSPHLSALKVPS